MNSQGAGSEHVDSLLHVNAGMLRHAAERIRSGGEGVATLRIGVEVSAAQLDAAAKLLDGAEPSIITHVSGAARGITVGVEQACPGFIHVAQQVAPDVLTFVVGVIGSTYHIDRDGAVRDVPA